jgi:hypothetical protein
MRIHIQDIQIQEVQIHHEGLQNESESECESECCV